MSTTLKKAIKYLVILGLLATVVFFGIKIFFPAPSSTMAYEMSNEVLSNNFKEIKDSNEEFLDFYPFFESNPKMQETLSYSVEAIELQLEVLNQIYPALIFAKNSSIYNSKTKELQKQRDDVLKAFKTANDFIENDFAATFKQTPPPSNSVLKTITQRFLSNNKEISKTLTAFTETVSTIYNNLETTFTTNAYSKKIVQISTAWISVQNSFLNDEQLLNDENFTYQKAKNNLDKLSIFIEEFINNEIFLSYNTEQANIDLVLQSLSKANVNGLLTTLEISNVDDFINSIENEEIKNSTLSLKTFILGGI